MDRPLRSLFVTITSIHLTSKYRLLYIASISIRVLIDRRFCFYRRNNVRFFPNHGKNARIIPGSRGRTADRLYCEYEFSQSIILVNQTLQDGELFAVSVDKLNDRWSGSIEVG